MKKAQKKLLIHHQKVRKQIFNMFVLVIVLLFYLILGFLNGSEIAKSYYYINNLNSFSLKCQSCKRIKMKNILHKILILLTVTFLANCATKTTTQIKKDSYKSGCEEETKILRSYGDTLRIEHAPNDSEKALNAAFPAQ